MSKRLQYSFEIPSPNQNQLFGPNLCTISNIWNFVDFQAFQRRYFVLKGNLLFYFERRTDREPIGVVILEGCTIELAEEDHER